MKILSKGQNILNESTYFEGYSDNFILVTIVPSSTKGARASNRLKKASL
jgi:hypothetical protein